VAFVFIVMAGYSGTPLQKKLGLKPCFKFVAIGSPKSYFDWISPLPENVKFVSKGKDLDFVHLFTTEKKHFQKSFVANRDLLQKSGMMWISWPKKSSGVATDLDENIIRDFGLKNGMVDVKVCAVDETWSGLKFMFRLVDR
jgi:hypothetical protein